MKFMRLKIKIYILKLNYLNYLYLFKINHFRHFIIKLYKFEKITRNLKINTLFKMQRNSKNYRSSHKG